MEQIVIKRSERKTGAITLTRNGFPTLSGPSNDVIGIQFGIKINGASGNEIAAMNAQSVDLIVAANPVFHWLPSSAIPLCERLHRDPTCIQLSLMNFHRPHAGILNSAVERLPGY